MEKGFTHDRGLSETLINAVKCPMNAVVCIL